MIPSQQQIEEIGNRLAESLGSGVHILPADLVFSVDTAFPTITDDEFQAVRNVCVTVAEKIRSKALCSMWGNEI